MADDPRNDDATRRSPHAVGSDPASGDGQLPPIDVTRDFLRGDTGQADSGYADSGSQPRPLPTMDNYVLLEELGRGGMGVVYKARQLSLNRIVALKMVLAGAHASEQALRRFAREAAAVARLKHPNIVQVHDFGQSDGHPFFAMEYVEGKDLQSAAQLPPRDAANIVQQLARAVHFAHQQGIIHRDIKPANVLVDATGVPKLTDFGLAKMASDEATLSLTGQDQLVGTAAYMPPEQARGDTVTAATDVYALGALLYQLLTSQPPFLGRSALDILKKVQQTEPFPPRRLVAHIPRDLETICLKCLEKNPERRYATAEALADDLQRFLDDRPITSRRVGIAERTARWVRRSTVAKVGLALLCVAAAAATWRYVDYRLYRRHTTRYFADMVTRGGEWRGVGPVEEAARLHRGLSLALVTEGSRGPLLYVESRSATGRPIPSLRLSSLLDPGSHDMSKYTIVRLDVERDAAGQPTKLVAKDRTNRPLWSFVYTKYPTKGHYVDRDGDERSRSGTGAAYVEFTFNDEGYIQETRFLDAQSYPAPNVHGVYGLRVLEWQDGLPVLITHLDADGHPQMQQGVTYWKRTYDSHGWLTELACLDDERQLTFSADGFARTTHEYDPYGNETAVAFWDLDGNPVAINAGYARLERQMYPDGTTAYERFLAPDGQPVARRPEGAAEIRYTYDQQGNLTRTSYLDELGRLSPTKYGYSGRLTERDEFGNIILQELLDTQWQPTLGVEGVFRKRYVLDADARILSIENFDTEGKPTVNRENWARAEYQYNRAGDEILRQYFGADGRPILCRDGYSRWEGVYDSRGNLVDETFYDTDGQPTVAKVGYASSQATFNQQGKITEHRLLDANGQPLVSREGYHRIVMDYDVRGREIRRRYYDPNDRLTWYKNGYAEVRNRYDDRGNRIEAAYFDPEGAPTMGRDGYHRVTTRYDHRGLPREIAYFDTDGNPTFSAEDRAAKIEMDYDRRGNLVAQRFFDLLGNPLHALETTFSPRGEVLQTVNTDGRGNVVEQSGVARIVFEYDTRGYQTASTCFDRQGQRTDGAGGVCRIEYTRDHFGNALESRFVDPSGAPTAANDGHGSVRRKYDLFGNVIEEAYFDVEGNRFFSPQLGYSIVRTQYNIFGQPIDVAYFGTDNQPVLYQGTHHRTVTRYEEGNPVETAFYGLDGQPALNAEGQARIEREFDRQGNETVQWRYGLDGQLTDEGLGWAREVAEYDPLGNPIHLEWFDAQGQPAAGDWGYSAERRYYDPLGRLIAYEYYLGDGQRALHQPNLYWRAERKEDLFGNEVQLRYFGLDGQPTNTAGGYAERNLETDRFGKVVSTSYYDADGTRLTPRVVIEEMVPDGAAATAGLQVGDVLVRLDGVPITDVQMFTYRRDGVSSNQSTLQVLRGDESLQLTIPTGTLGVLLRDRFD